MELKKVNINDLVPHPKNYNTHPDNQLMELEKSLDRFGQYKNIVVCNNTILAGHGLVEAAKRKGEKEIYVLEKNDLTEDEQIQLLIADNALPFGALPDTESLADLITQLGGLEEIDLPGITEEWVESIGINNLLGKEEQGNTDPDEIPEVKESICKLGDLWRLGDHRLLCGDCTDKANIEKLMCGEKAVLLHSDPPYGMGKENDGIANDNLYKDKLDKFQMSWWCAVRPNLEDNASAYIWGNAPDLWRLWYVGGLNDSERLTFRNEIVWDKYVGNVKPTKIEQQRSYVKYREDCLFFMLGEQGFNNNADNYWKDSSRYGNIWKVKSLHAG